MAHITKEDHIEPINYNKFSELKFFLQRNKILLSLGFILACSLTFFLIISEMRRDTYLIEPLYFIPFFVYTISIYWIYKTQKNIQYPVEKNKRRIKEIFIIIIIFSIIFRGIFLLTTPSLSDDIYRYNWDGKISNNGINPYLYPPNAEELSQYQDSNWEKINAKDVPTIYPPFSQIIFRLSYSLSPDILTLKIIFITFDILSIAIIFLLLLNLNINPHYSIIYAWSPLVIIEFAHSAHNDSLAIFFVVLSFWLLQKKMKSTSSIILALAVLTKLYPIIFAGVFFRRWGKKNTALFFGIIGLLYLPFLNAGTAVFSGTLIYIESWFFNGSIFPALVSAFGFLNVFSDPIFISKILVAGIFGVTYLFYFRKSWAIEDDNLALFRFAFILTGLLLLLSSTIHPWYIIWIIPFLCIFQNRAWILLSGLVFLSYTVYVSYDTNGIWAEIWWIRILEYIPFYLLLIYDISLLQKVKLGLNRIYKKVIMSM